MKNIKSFKNFLNEELSPDTYKSAAEKLKGKGHEKRARDLEDYAKSFTGKVKPVTITMDGLDYTLDSDNVVVYNESPSSVNINVFGDNRLIDPVIAWEDTEIRNKFLSEYGYFNVPDVKFYDLDDLDDLDDKTVEEFVHHINDIQPLNLNLDIDGNTGIDVTGTIIEDRRTAVKLLRFLKDFGKNHGGNVEKFINELTVNDLYTN